jgi:BTB/POZ domain-containing protein KCTD9
VLLNVGGKRYETTVGTLTKQNDSMLAVMFSGRHRIVKEGKDGSVFIDRDGTHFRYILKYVRFFLQSSGGWRVGREE